MTVNHHHWKVYDWRLNKLTPFANKVYKIVLRIPLGELRTYRWVAAKAGKPRSFRAVGQLMKRNPYPFFIPCHRVIRSNGDIGGYAFGRKRKLELLKLEQLIRKTMV